MCLSEPRAGSSLGDIRTRAVAESDDEFGARYRLTGNKMWISAVIRTLVRTSSTLSSLRSRDLMGIYPKGRRHFSLYRSQTAGRQPERRRSRRINHKMGFRGTSNCLLNFGERGGTMGWRIGDPGQGLAQMFMMMNDAHSRGLGRRGSRLSRLPPVAAVCWRKVRDDWSALKGERRFPSSGIPTCAG
jgi:alkylation response protein AidB-like acyl-CoA dehydrogenase